MPPKKRGRPKGSRSKSQVPGPVRDSATSNDSIPALAQTQARTATDGAPPTVSPTFNPLDRSPAKLAVLDANQSAPRVVRRSRVQQPPKSVSSSPLARAAKSKGKRDHWSLIVCLKLPAILLRGIATKDQKESKDVLRKIDSKGVTQNPGKNRKNVSFIGDLAADLERIRSKMAPVGPRDGDRMKDNEIDVALKETIQNLFDIQAATLGYVPETQVELVNKIENLTISLQNLRALTTKNLNSSAPLEPIVSTALPLIPPEIIQYVDEGRNPDIYTREFVESIIRYNQNINGKRKAFADFTDIFAQELMKGVPGVDSEVNRVLNAKDRAVQEQQNGVWS